MSNRALSHIGVIIALFGVIVLASVLFVHPGGPPAVQSIGASTPSATAAALATSGPGPANTATAGPNAVATSTAVPQVTSAPVGTAAGPAASAVASSIPQPIGTALPGASATAGPTATPQVVTTKFATLPVPSTGWFVAAQSDYAAFLDHLTPDNSGNLDGEVSLVDFPTTGPGAVQGYFQTVLASYLEAYPDAKQCGSEEQTTVGGMAGTAMQICYTGIAETGDSYPAVAALWAAESLDSTQLYSILELGAASNQAFFAAAGQLLQGIVWEVT